MNTHIVVPIKDIEFEIEVCEIALEGYDVGATLLNTKQYYTDRKNFFKKLLSSSRQISIENDR